jgi:hypothetical protein
MIILYNFILNIFQYNQILMLFIYFINIMLVNDMFHIILIILLSCLHAIFYNFLI